MPCHTLRITTGEGQHAPLLPYTGTGPPLCGASSPPMITLVSIHAQVHYNPASPFIQRVTGTVLMGPAVVPSHRRSSATTQHRGNSSRITSMFQNQHTISDRSSMMSSSRCPHRCIQNIPAEQYECVSKQRKCWPLSRRRWHLGKPYVLLVSAVSPNASMAAFTSPPASSR